MSRTNWMLGALGAAGITAMASTMLLSDSQVDNTIADIQSTLPPSIELVVSEDQSSFAQRHLVLSLNIHQADKTLKIAIDNQIDKRPWGTAIEHQVQISELFGLTEISDQSHSRINRYFVDQPFVTGETKIGLLGGFHSYLKSESLAETSSDLSFMLHPILIDVNGDRSGQFEMTGHWLGVEFEGFSSDPVYAEWRPMFLTMDGRYESDTLFLGRQIVEGEGFAFSSDKQQVPELSLGKYSATSNNELKGDRISSEFSFRADDLSFQEPGNELLVTDFVSSWVVEGISVSNYTNLMTHIRDMQTFTGQLPPGLMAEATTLLKNGFTVALPEWKATINDHELAFDAHFELPENEIADLNNPFALLGLVTQIRADAHLKLDEALTDIPDISVWVNRLIQADVLVKKNGYYQMAVSMENGQPLLNGSPIPIPF